MTTRFKDQGGAASSNPSWLRRWITSQMMRRLADPRRRDAARARSEAQRQRAGEPHRVEYFHQVDDPYSHLAVQLLDALRERYAIEIVPQLVPGASGANAPEPALLAAYARRDAAAVAPHYGLSFAPDAVAPTGAAIAGAQCILAAADATQFAASACAVEAALWAGDEQALQQLANDGAVASTEAARARLQAGEARRRQLGHYAGAMFHYGGEWYWGVDRLYHLEQRLLALGASRRPDAPLLAPRPGIEAPAQPGDGSLTLEYYASLRSPYTSIIHEQVLRLARAAGVRLLLRPVLPMVMRGVPVTVQKGRYIFFDTAREAATLGLEWGHACDPIGEPVRRVYALLPWAQASGCMESLLGAALRAAFFEGRHLGRDGVLQSVVESVGLSWQQARPLLQQSEWESQFEENRRCMYAAGLWGVPAFRLLDAAGNERLASWGQDRLWLIAREIQRMQDESRAADPR